MNLRKPFTKHVYPRLVWIYDRSPRPAKRVIDRTIGKIIPKPASDYEIDTVRLLAKSSQVEVTREPGLSFTCEVTGSGGAFDQQDLVLIGPGDGRAAIRASAISPRAVQANGPVFSRYHVDIPPEVAKGLAGTVRVETAEGEPLAEIKYDRLDWEFAHISRLVKMGELREEGGERSIRDVAATSANLIGPYFGRSPESKSLARLTFLWIDLLIDRGAADMAAEVAFRLPHGDLMERETLAFVEMTHRIASAVDARFRRRLHLKYLEDESFASAPFHEIALVALDAGLASDDGDDPASEERLQLQLERFARRHGFSNHALRLTATIAEARLSAAAAWETHRRILRDYYYRYR